MGDAKRKRDHARTVQARAAEFAELMRVGDPARQCGPCTACCTTTEVEELKKPSGIPCQHLRDDGGGCTIHATKPNVCAEWMCGWRLGFGRDDERPDVVGYVLEVSRHNKARGAAPHSISPREAFRHLWLYAHDVAPGAAAAATNRLREIAEESGGAIEVEAERHPDGKSKFAFLGPEGEMMAGVALLESHKIHLPTMPVPLWRTPATQAKAQALLATHGGEISLEQLAERLRTKPKG